MSSKKSVLWFQSMDFYHAELQEGRMSAGYCPQSAGESEPSPGKTSITHTWLMSSWHRPHQDFFAPLQIQLQPGWLEELPVDHNVYLGKDADPESLALIHLYRVMWSRNVIPQTHLCQVMWTRSIPLVQVSHLLFMWQRTATPVWGQVMTGNHTCSRSSDWRHSPLWFSCDIDRGQ